MIATLADIATFLEILTVTPQRLASASAGLENTRLHFKPDQKAWSANDIPALHVF